MAVETLMLRPRHINHTARLPAAALAHLPPPRPLLAQRNHLLRHQPPLIHLINHVYVWPSLLDRQHRVCPGVAWINRQLHRQIGRQRQRLHMHRETELPEDQALRLARDRPKTLLE